MSLVGCGSETSRPPRADASTDAADVYADDVIDAAALSDADAPLADSNAPRSDVTSCTPDDEPKPCFAIGTGCPTMTVCWAPTGTLHCPCRHCIFDLEARACSWTVYSDYPYAGFVNRIGLDGGSTRVPFIEPGPCLDDDFGYFVSAVPGTLTVTLCPASCREHQDDPTIRFELERGPCPPT
jgi:hypothetical protein